MLICLIKFLNIMAQHLKPENMRFGTRQMSQSDLMSYSTCLGTTHKMNIISGMKLNVDLNYLSFIKLFDQIVCLIFSQ